LCDVECEVAHAAVTDALSAGEIEADYREAASFAQHCVGLRGSANFSQIPDQALISETVLHPVTVLIGSNCRVACAIVPVWGAPLRMARAK